VVPLHNGRPDPERLGETFRKFIGKFKRHGYKAQWRVIVAANKGAPTTRRRLFIIMRCDGLPIVWPEDTHGKPGSPAVISGKRKPWRTAAECIDWSLPCPSIFDTSAEIMAKHGVRAVRPLAPNTMARIAAGVRRYVLDTANPFIVPITHTGDQRVHGLDEPMRTVTTAHRGEHALIIPTLIQTGYGERPRQYPRVPGLHIPLGTAVDGQKHAAVTAFLAQHNTDMVGHDCREPVSTIVGKGCTQAVVSAGLINLKGTDRRWSAPGAPAPTVTAHGWHVGEVRAFLTKFHRDGGQLAECSDPMHTIDCRDRYGLVTVSIAGETYAIVDIGMRMLTPRELFRAQGFPDSFVIDHGVFADGRRPVLKTDQIRLVGNSVCPQVAAALVSANYRIEEVNADGVPEFALQAAE
jgi:DNA (cytosine-5)-methyltransferase 1